MNPPRQSHVGRNLIIVIFVLLFVLLGAFLIWYFLRKRKQGDKCSRDSECSPLFCINGICNTKIVNECSSNIDCLITSTKPPDSYCATNFKCDKLSNISCQTNSDCPIINQTVLGFYNYTIKGIDNRQTILSSFCFKSDLSQAGFCAYGKNCLMNPDCVLSNGLYMAPLLPLFNTYLKAGTVNDVLQAGDLETGCLSDPGQTSYCTS